MQKNGMIFILLMGLIGCATVKSFNPFAPLEYEAVPDSAKFYADKLKCETTYTKGYSFFGGKVYGDIYKEGTANDCMLSKGYRIVK